MDPPKETYVPPHLHAKPDGNAQAADVYHSVPWNPRREALLSSARARPAISRIYARNKNTGFD